MAKTMMASADGPLLTQAFWPSRRNPPSAALARVVRRFGWAPTLGSEIATDRERPAHAAWADDFAAELSGGDPAAYAGFLDDEGEARVRAAYPGGTYERLAAVKAAYDPDNLFRRNQNIAPAA